MSVLNLKIFGREIDDALFFRILLGTICIIILLIAIGWSSFSDWILKSLVIWSAVTMIVLPLTFGFIEEEFTAKHLTMLISGIVILVIFGIYSKLSFGELAISVIQSLVWMTLFSIILDLLKEKSQGIFKKT